MKAHKMRTPWVAGVGRSVHGQAQKPVLKVETRVITQPWAPPELLARGAECA